LKDPWNPTEAEIFAWAFDANASYPDQDWDLVIADLRYKHLMLFLATNKKCPKRDFFLSCLYLIVREAVQSNWQNFKQVEIEQLLIDAHQYDDAEISRWIERTKALIADPSHFDPQSWDQRLL
jgi:hypothetical protein